MAAKKPLSLNSSSEPQQFQTGDFLDVPFGGTGAITAGAARTNLGLAIGTNVQAWDADLDAIAAFSSTGLAVRTASNTWAQRSLATASASRITMTNGDGVSGNPTVDLASGIITTPGAYFQTTIDTYGRVTAGANPTTLAGFGITDAVAKAGSTMTGLLILSGDPSTALGAATKQYVDNNIQGLQTKPTAQAATTAAVTATYSNGASGVGATLTVTATGVFTVDGYATVLNDLVLFKDQTSQFQNGLYQCTVAGTTGVSAVFTRQVDMDTAAEFSGAFVPVGNLGTLNRNSLWLANPSGAVTVGTTAIPFSQLNGATDLIAGNAISISGNTIAVTTISSGRITVASGGVDLASGIVTPGTYTKLTVDTYGRATVGATAVPSDIGAQASSTELTGLAALSSNGLVTRTASGTYTSRSVIAPAAGITVTNGDGVAGNPTLVLANDLGALEALSSTGIAVRTGTDTWAQRTATGTARVVITNGDGVSGNPTFDLATGVMASPGTYNSVTVDTYGRVTAGTNVASSADQFQEPLTNNQGSTINIGRAVYSDATGTVKLAIATGAATKRVVGLVKDVTISNGVSGTIAVGGIVTATTTQWDAVTSQSGGLTTGAAYYLSDASAGAFTTTAPSTTGNWVAPVGIAISTTQFQFSPQLAIQL